MVRPKENALSLRTAVPTLCVAMAAILAGCVGGADTGAGESSAAGSDQVGDQQSSPLAASRCTLRLTPANLVASVAQAENPAANVADGDLATRWSGRGKGAYVTADLGAAQSICSISLAWYNGGVDGRIYDYALSTSTDGRNFSPLVSGKSLPSTALQPIEFQAVDARYVRLTVNGNNVNDYASVTELQITANAAPASAFVHPGILVSREQLDFVKAKIGSGQQPWSKEYQIARDSNAGGRGYVASPVPVVKCSTPGSRQKAIDQGYDQAGCGSIIDDSSAAYTQALLWYYSGDAQYAENARKILNAWARTLTAILFDQPRFPDNNHQVYANGQLNAGWAGTKFLRAAEILRYTYSGWTAEDTALQEGHFRTVYWDLVKDGWTGGGNVTAVMNETALDIAIFTNDLDKYEYVVSQLQHSSKAMIYMPSDGPQPLYPMYQGRLRSTNDERGELAKLWSNPTRYIAGLEQETCRDLGHMQMGMGSLANMAETLRIQGDARGAYSDDPARHENRLREALELNADYTLQYLDNTRNRFNVEVAPLGWVPARNWPCSRFSSNAGGFSAAMGWELGYNEFHNRRGINMPKTEELITRVRAMSRRETRVGNHIGWETLTHAGAP
ncbi:discoidin domain-containing protein [Sorangium sp. So ce1099]|uniref:discoidin domain-containing protein n=1 Tax=Sorangium sp. So ce1099 TaxID=3133331 RepID=UPI003F62F820